MGLIACYYRAAEWYHREIELAAHDLLLHLDNARELRGASPELAVWAGTTHLSPRPDENRNRAATR